MPRICRLLPLPLGEGLGEGPSDETQKYYYLFLPCILERTGKSMEEFSFLVTQLRPHPNPLPKGEGFYLEILGTLRT